MGMTIGTGIGYAFKAYRGGKGWRNIGKTLTFTVPEIPGTNGTFEWVKAKDGTLERESNEPGAERGSKDKVILAGPASYGSNWGPVNLITSYGHSIVAPSKFEASAQVEKAVIAEWVANYKRLPRNDKDDGGKDKVAFASLLESAMANARKIATRFLIWDPLTYYNATRENDMQDLYNSGGTDKDPWYARLLVIGVFGVLGLVLLLFGVVILKVLPALQAANGG